MFDLLILLEAGADTPSDNPGAIVTPYLPLLGIILGGILVGVFNAHNRRKGNIETRAPDVNAIWTQQAYQSQELDKERKLRRRIENYAWELLDVFHGYVKRVMGGGSYELTHHEKLFFSSDPPTSEIPTDKQERS